eukprot:1485658-Pyramimonas_sp.AAC.1
MAVPPPMQQRWSPSAFPWRSSLPTSPAWKAQTAPPAEASLARWAGSTSASRTRSAERKWNLQFNVSARVCGHPASHARAWWWLTRSRQAMRLKASSKR